MVLSCTQERRELERLLNGLARARLVRLEEDAFEKNGATIRFRRVSITPRGVRVVRGEVGLEGLELPAEDEAAPTRRRKKKKKKVAPIPQAAPELLETLRKWRITEAVRRDLPAFCIMNDRTLRAIAGLRPKNEQALLDVPGVGGKLIERYGEQVLAIVAEE